MSITTPTPDPTPDDIERGLAALERHLAAAAPAVPAVPQPVEGETKRVRQLRAEVAEAHLLAELQDDDAPILLDTAKVRKRRKAAHEAARLHELAQDPAMRAYQAARMRRLLLTGGMISLTLALIWSTAGVQEFAADGAEMWSPAWVFAWFVEPFMSLALLVIVGAKAFMATRGQPIRSKTLTRIECLFLGLTLGMNAFPYLPGVAETFSFPRLVFHSLGPIVAVAIVTALPIVLAAFNRLDHRLLPDQSETPPASDPEDSSIAGRSPGRRGKPPRGRTLAEHRAELHRLIAEGVLPPLPSARAIQRALRCREEVSRTLREELKGGRR